jgi:hypothetical protein
MLYAFARLRRSAIFGAGLLWFNVRIRPILADRDQDQRLDCGLPFQMVLLGFWQPCGVVRRSLRVRSGLLFAS